MHLYKSDGYDTCETFGGGESETASSCLPRTQRRRPIAAELQLGSCQQQQRTASREASERERAREAA